MAWDDAPPDTESSSWDSEPPKKEELGSQWSDLPKNIIPNAKAIGTNAVGTAGKIAKGVFDLPSDLAQTAKQELTGGNPLNTPIAQDVKTVGSGVVDAIKGIPESLGNLASKEQWIKQPVSNAMTAGAVLAPMMAPEEGIASSIGKGMQEKGAALANDLGEVSGNTVKKINPRLLGEEAQSNIRKAGSTSNIADVRSEVGSKLIKDNVVGGFGQDVGDRLQKVNELKETYGNQVKTALNEIRKTNHETGEYADVDDALHVQATPILKSVLDVANELRNSARSGLRQTSRFWRETYNSLASKAETNSGRLNFDDIQSELKEVGKEMNIATPTSPRYATAKDIYGHLADIRDQMVDKIAEQSGNKDLGNNLVNANKQFSFYSKMAEGLQDAGAGGEVPEKMGKHLVRSTMRGDPMHATGYMGLMKLLNAIEPAMAQKLSRWGPGVAKYGGALEAAAKQGPRNLAITDHLLKQRDPEYANAMK